MMDVISHLPPRLPCLSSLGLLVIASQGLWCSTDLVGFTGAPDPIILFPKQSFVWLLHLYLTSYLYWTTVQALRQAFDSTICGDFLRLNESLELE